MSLTVTINHYLKAQRLIRRAKSLQADCRLQNDIAGVVDAVLNAKKFSLVQKRSEILRFVEIVSHLKPKIICDIGSSGGGTIRLFSHYAHQQARILSVDVNNTPIRQRAFPHLIGPDQQITVLQGSSYAPQTIEFLKNWLKQEPIDLLFIDGDHSYEGVSQDYRLYAPYVRKGGIIGLHDIVPDFKTRFGQETPSYVGEVPKFWQQLKQENLKTQEFIEDPDQDGFGIGVVIK